MYYRKIELFPVSDRVKFMSTVQVNIAETRGLYRITKQPQKDIRVIFDTGCRNTLIPYDAYLMGLAHKTDVIDYVTVSGHDNVEVFGVYLDKLKIGKYTLPYVFGFTSENISGGVLDNIILGANVFSRWRYVIDSEAHTLQFREKKPFGVKQLTYPHYFDRTGKLLLVE
ncbi:hypothetical protein AGMMS49975_10450 [Clostridia bacterium]|nr:hypothetical protein AGMMS49975_10450 [Clostridia bacterium]